MDKSIMPLILALVLLVGCTSSLQFGNGHGVSLSSNLFSVISPSSYAAFYESPQSVLVSAKSASLPSNSSQNITTVLQGGQQTINTQTQTTVTATTSTVAPSSLLIIVGNLTVWQWLAIIMVIAAVVHHIRYKRYRRR